MTHGVGRDRACDYCRTIGWGDKAECDVTVALTNNERFALWQAGDHHPELCDCAGDDWSADGEWCEGLEDTFAAVERIIAARQTPALTLIDAAIAADAVSLSRTFDGGSFGVRVDAHALRDALAYSPGEPT